jgi:hypothetical protein
MFRTILLSTAVAGTLDILWAASLTLWRGRSILGMLQFVASGPFPAATDWGLFGAITGLAVHFSLMAIMAGAFMFAWVHFDPVARNPVWSGLGYGILTYVVLDLIVVPLRFAAAWPPSPLSITTQLFAHLVLVGLVFAMIAKRRIAPSSELANIQPGVLGSL